MKKWPFYYGWVIVAVIFVGGFADTFQSLPVLSIFLTPITDDFGWSHTTFALAIVIGTLIGAVVAPFFGARLDRHGGRWALVGGLSILGGAMLSLSAISSLWQFFALQILARAMHMGVITMALLGTIIPRWFILRRGRAVAISGLGLRGGLTLNPLFVQFLVARWTWRTAAVGVGLMIWIISVLPSAIFIRRSPEDVGLLPDGESPEQREARITLAARSAGASARDIDASLTLAQVLRLPQFYLMTISFSLALLVTSGISFNAIPFFIDQGLPDGAAVGVVSLYGAVAAVGMLASGFVTEKVSIRWALVVASTGMGVAVFAMLAADSVAEGLAWAVGFGIVEGSVFTMQQIAFADYFGRQFLGSIRGVLWAVQTLANAIGTIAGAIVFDTTDGYGIALIFFGCCGVAAGILMFFARPPRLNPSLASPLATPPDGNPTAA